MAEKWIDVSAHNGMISWPKVSASGVKGAILRAGYGNSLSQTDTQFTANIKGAVAAGLKVGVYWFGYPDSIADARAEWAVCKKVIEPYRDSILFVCYDYEYDSAGYYKKIHGAAPANALINSMVAAFISTAHTDGYKTALYTNNDYRLHVFAAATLTAADYLWLADYSGAPDVSCAIQQTGSSGTVPGIRGSVDMDTVFAAIALTTVQIDTTCDVTIECGKYYTFRTNCNQQPVVTVGTAGVVGLMHCRRERDADFYHLCAIGEPGAETGIYTAAPGEQPLKRFKVRVK